MNTDRLRIFRSPSDPCGCGPSSGFPGYAPPIVPPSACAAICDDRYLQLAQVFGLRLLGVEPGSNCQSFLKPVGGLEGLMWLSAAGLAYSNRTPALTLPFINPAVAGVFPSTNTFTALMASASATDERAWQMFAAPTVGTWLLEADNGVFRFVDAGAIPGLSTVCASQLNATVINLIGCAKIGEDGGGEPIWALRKLNTTPASGRIVVSFVPDDAVAGFRTLPLDVELYHPSIRTDTLKVFSLVMTDEDGVPIVGGLPIDDRTIQTDAVAVSYSPTSKSFWREAPKTYSITTVNAGAAFSGIPAAYAALPGGHGVTPALSIKHGKALIQGMVNFGADEEVDLAIFRDGVSIASFKFGTPETASFFHIDTGINPAVTHVYELQWKKGGGPGTGSGTIRTSSIAVISLPE